ncbi:tetratricopeptide repeat protein [Hyphomonas sp.]|jgi:tetratricopeptide (TPR) repeat protein|uniref:tetratricopeptide repeat protein n=1 Tax=Hyphomonas sp. TaxID=87 RepID=UPI0039E3A77B
MKPIALLPALLLLFAAPGAEAGPVVYHSGKTLAETCAARVAAPDAHSAKLLRLCEAALEEADLTPATYAATLTNTGIVKMRRGELDDALADFEAARAKDSASPDVAINLGAVLVRMNRFDEAVDALSEPQSISRERRHVAYFNRAIAHWALDDVAQAYNDLTEAAALKPDYAPAREMLQHFQVADAR